MQNQVERQARRTKAGRVVALLAALAGCAGLALSCSPARGPAGGSPEATCTRACTRRAASHCSDDECARGCRFVLDRLVEHEGDRVIDCVARAGATEKAACGDALFADCAARIGEHADGGPPAPPPPEEL